MRNSDGSNASQFADAPSASAEDEAALPSEAAEVTPKLSPTPGSTANTNQEKDVEGKDDSSSSAMVDRLQSKVARLTAMLEKERSRWSGSDAGGVTSDGRKTFDGGRTARGRKRRASDGATGTSGVGPALAALMPEELPDDALFPDDDGDEDASLSFPSGAVVEIEETETAAVGQNGMNFAAWPDLHVHNGTGAASALVLSPSHNVEWAEDGGMGAEISPLETALIPSLDDDGGHQGGSRRRHRGRARVWGHPTRFCSEAIRGTHTPSGLLCAIAVLGIIFVSCLVTELFDRIHRSSTEFRTDPNDPSKKPRPAGLERIDRITACAQQLSGSSDIFGKGRNPQIEAVDWFVLGTGRSVPAPEHCAWESLFGTMFALMVLRGALNVTAPSWHDEAIAVESVEDVCRHFKKIACNDDKTSVTELHLADSGASGTIPDEIGGLRFLRRLDLSENKGVGGRLPSTVGDMTDLQHLYLHETSVTGNIPETLGKLVNLKELFLDRTGLEGLMPEGICKLKGGELLAIHADCGGDKPRVECRSPDCCDKCLKPKK